MKFMPNHTPAKPRGKWSNDASFIDQAPKWRHYGAMPVNLSIKNAPDDVVMRLRERAARNHRSVQGELLAIVEAAVRPNVWLTPLQVVAEARRLGLSSSESSVDLIRADRDRDG
jgi:plasmid stability protein